MAEKSEYDWRTWSLRSVGLLTSIKGSIIFSGYWGEACDREILPAMHEPVLPAFFTHIVIYLLVVLVIVLTYFICDRLENVSRSSRMPGVLTGRFKVPI